MKRIALFSRARLALSRSRPRSAAGFLLPLILAWGAPIIAPAAQLSIVSEPAGAQLFLDNQHIGETPWSGEFPVVASVVQVKLSKPGYKEIDQIVRVARSSAALEYQLDPLHGGYILMAPPATRVTLQLPSGETEALGTIPTTGRMAEPALRPAGEYSLILIREGYERVVVPFVLANGTTDTLILQATQWEPIKAEVFLFANQLIPPTVMVNGVETTVDPATSIIKVPGETEVTVALNVPGFRPVEKILPPIEPGGYSEIDFGALQPFSGGLRLVVLRPDGSPLTPADWAATKVTVDGRQAPLTEEHLLADLSIGEHRLAISNESYADVAETFTLEGEDVIERRIQLVGKQATLAYNLSIEAFPTDLMAQTPSMDDFELEISPEPLEWNRTKREVTISAGVAYDITAKLPYYLPRSIHINAQRDGTRLPIQISLRTDFDQMQQLRNDLAVIKREAYLLDFLREQIATVSAAAPGAINREDKRNADRLMQQIRDSYPSVLERSAEARRLLERFREIVYSN